jgi:hypothetical protein
VRNRAAAVCTTWLSDIRLIAAGHAAVSDRYVGYALLEEVRNAAQPAADHTAAESNRRNRGVRDPRPKQREKILCCSTTLRTQAMKQPLPVT